MCLVPDHHAVQQFVAAALDPPLHDRVHARHRDTAEHDPEPAVGKDRVEQRRVADVAVTDQETRPASRVPQVHHEGAYGLGHPGGGGVHGGAQDPDPPSGVVDDCQDVHPGTGERHRFDDVGGEDGVGRGAQERRPAGRGALGCWVDAGILKDLPDGGRGDRDAQDGQLTVDAPVPPRAVLPRQTEHQRPDRPDRRRTAGPLGAGDASRVCGDHVAVPAQHGLGAYQQPDLAEHGAGEPV